MGWFLIVAVALTLQSNAAACSGCFQTQALRATSNNMFPQWSPDSRRIVFTSDRDGDPEIYVKNADGSNVVCLAESHKKAQEAQKEF